MAFRLKLAAVAVLLLYYGFWIWLGTVYQTWSPVWAVYVFPLAFLSPLAYFGWRSPMASGWLLVVLGLLLGVLIGWLTGLFVGPAVGSLNGLVFGGPLIVAGLLFLLARTPGRHTASPR